VSGPPLDSERLRGLQCPEGAERLRARLGRPSRGIGAALAAVVEWCGGRRYGLTPSRSTWRTTASPGVAQTGGPKAEPDSAAPVPQRTSVAARSQDSPFDRIPTAKRRCTRPKSSRTTNRGLGSPDSSRRRRRPIRRPRKPSRSPIPRLRSRGGESPDAYARSRWRPRRAQPPGTVPWRSGCRHSNRAVGAVPSVEAIARDMRGFSARWGESSCDA
jgi:hypothetical protein